MRNKVIKCIRCTAFVAALFAGAQVATADDAAGGKEPETIGSQVQSILQSGAPEQAAMVQMGLTQQQLNVLMGPQQPEEEKSSKKFVYKPKDPTEVEKPPRLFYNIPKWQ